MSILRKSSVSFLLLFGLCLASCDNTAPSSDPLPYKYVYETVYLNTLQAQPLNTLNGNFIYIAGGLDSIIVYRHAAGDFYAIERRSPHVKHCRCRVNISKTYIEDVCSGSQFNFDGTLISGAAGAYLRRYNANFDGTKILITN